MYKIHKCEYMCIYIYRERENTIEMIPNISIWKILIHKELFTGFFTVSKKLHKMLMAYTSYVLYLKSIPNKSK